MNEQFQQTSSSGVSDGKATSDTQTDFDRGRGTR